MESATTMSACRRSASASATSVLPSAVAPNRASTGGAAQASASAPARRQRLVALAVAHHAEALQGERLARGDAGLAPRDVDLRRHVVYALQGGQQHAAPQACAHDDAVARRVEVVRVAGLAGRQHVHAADERIQLVLRDGRESAGPGRRRRRRCAVSRRPAHALIGSRVPMQPRRAPCFLSDTKQAARRL